VELLAFGAGSHRLLAGPFAGAHTPSGVPSGALPHTGPRAGSSGRPSP
jgi:hypothetical protein